MTSAWDQLSNTARLWMLYVLMWFFAAFWLWHGSRAVLDGRWLYALFYLPGAIAWLAAWFPIGEVHRHRRPEYRPDPRSVRVTNDGIVFRQSTAVRLSTVVAIVCTVIAGATFALGTWTGRLSFPMPSESQRLGFPVVGAALAVWYVVVGTWFLFGWARFPEVRCSPTTVTSRRFLFSQQLSWDEITDVEAVADGRNAGIHLATRGIDFVPCHRFAPVKFGTESGPVICPADLLAVGTYRLLDFLEFYRANSDARAELADERAVRRVLTAFCD